MRQNIEKLMLLGFGIILLSFLIINRVHAQAPSYNQPIRIQSTGDYLKVEKMIENISIRLYQINQAYPDFQYTHHYKGNELVSVTVSGISNPAIALEAAKYMMDIERLGDAVRQMNDAYLPEGPKVKKSDYLSEAQTAELYRNWKVDLNEQELQDLASVR